MAKTNPWMSVSDLMTGLMVIFLFVAIAYISKEQDRLKEQEEEMKKKESLIIDYVDNKRKLKEDLDSQFQSEIKDGTITITGDLSMRFENAETLFESGSYQLGQKFKQQLSAIIPRYLEVLMNDSIRTKIREIRIEGHTDDVYSHSNNPEVIYQKNLELSQDRAKTVLMYVRSLPAFMSYSSEQKELLEYWFTANGLSYGRALDRDGEYVQTSHRPIDREKSRRVEFRIIAADDEALNMFVKRALESK